jgi:lipopolysaccharide export system protein LptA
MDRRRFLQLAFTAVLILFLAILVLRFRPRMEVPAPVTQSEVKRTSEGTLSAKGFRYSQETMGRTEFTVTAGAVAESAGGVRLLEAPHVTFPGRGVARGKKGSFQAGDRTFRIWEEARMDLDSGWTAESSGFRLTPEGEVVTEGPVTFHREGVTGRAQLLRYQQDQQTAHLEGDVRVAQGDRTLACRILDLDLKTHAGKLEGPVVLASARGTVTAPAGTLSLDEQNRLKEVDLSSPCTGTGPQISFTCAALAARWSPGGDLEAVDLKGDVAVHDSRPPSSTLKTAALTLVPGENAAWSWTSPGALAILQETAAAWATSGSGSYGGAAPSAADLAGPVEGSQAQGTFRADRARMEGGDWRLLGRAAVDRPADRVAADEILFRADGSSVAKGGVRGERRPQEGPWMRFTCARAQAGPGGYPARLEGGAQVERGGMTLSAPEVFVADARTAVAQDGARAALRGADGRTWVVTGGTVSFDGAAHAATAQGDARGESGESWITADTLVVRLDPMDRPETYEAKGSARFSDPEYEGQGDLLTYDPATQEGTATGTDRDAVVVQRQPSRRVAGPVVDFAPGKAEVQAGGRPMRRGSLQGTQSEARGKGKSHGR